jgi:hypothetical protein
VSFYLKPLGTSAWISPRNTTRTVCATNFTSPCGILKRRKLRRASLRATVRYDTAATSLVPPESMSAGACFSESPLLQRSPNLRNGPVGAGFDHTHP